MAHMDRRYPRVRIRQAVRRGAPVLAAATTLAVAVAGATAWASSGPGSPRPGDHAAFAPGTFNPSVLTVGFGWLPKGSLVLEGQTSAGSEQLWVSSPHSRIWALAAYARNACRISATNGFDCVKAVRGGVVNVGSKNPVTGRGPAVNGHASFWVSSDMLAWEHAPGEWALVALGNGKLATTIRVAKAVKFAARAVPARYGQRVPLRYAVRFTSLPRGWQLIRLLFGRDSLHGVPGRDVYMASGFTIAKVRRLTATTQAVADAPFILFGPDHSANDCVFPHLPGRPPVPTRHVRIHGYRFVLAHSGTGKTTVQTLCGSPVDGLAVSITELGAHQHFPPTKVMERLELLGPKPANWVTSPMP
jgi:hypothetical protein